MKAVDLKDVPPGTTIWRVEFVIGELVKYILIQPMLDCDHHYVRVEDGPRLSYCYDDYGELFLNYWDAYAYWLKRVGRDHD